MTAKTTVTRDVLGLAAEYAVASELCRRGMYAQLTLGNYKRADILVDSATGMRRVQVKAKQEKEWPGVHGISKKADCLVLVDFQGKSLDESPDFYILGLRHWKRIIREEQSEIPELRVDQDLRVQYPDGWKGINLTVADVASAKSKWERVE